MKAGIQELVISNVQFRFTNVKQFRSLSKTDIFFSVFEKIRVLTDRIKIEFARPRVYAKNDSYALDFTY